MEGYDFRRSQIQEQGRSKGRKRNRKWFLGFSFNFHSNFIFPVSDPFLVSSNECN